MGSDNAGKIMILHGVRLDPDAVERMKADFKMANEAVDAGTCTYNIDPDLKYYRDLAEARRKRVNVLAVALVLVSTWLVFESCVRLFL